MKKVYTIIAATLLMASAAEAKTYTVSSGKWTDASIWNGDYAGATIKAEDVVIISGQVTINTSIVVEGTLQVEKGASMMGMKDLMVAKSGKFVNNGNTVMKRIINEGSISNNLVMEAMMELENKGSITNNNMIGSNDMQNYGGTAAGGKNGAYFVNNNIVTSPASKFGTDVKVFYGNSMDNQTTSAASPLNLEATIKSNNVVLNVSNPTKMEVATYSIEKSTDGNTYTLVEKISNVNNSVATIYTDSKVNSNLTYYRVKATGTNGQETTLPIATVKAPFGNALSMAQ